VNCVNNRAVQPVLYIIYILWKTSHTAILIIKRLLYARRVFWMRVIQYTYVMTNNLKNFLFLCIYCDVQPPDVECFYRECTTRGVERRPGVYTVEVLCRHFTRRTSLNKNLPLTKAFQIQNLIKFWPKHLPP